MRSRHVAIRKIMLHGNYPAAVVLEMFCAVDFLSWNHC